MSATLLTHNIKSWPVVPHISPSQPLTFNLLSFNILYDNYFVKINDDKLDHLLFPWEYVNVIFKKRKTSNSYSEFVGPYIGNGWSCAGVVLCISFSKNDIARS